MKVHPVVPRKRNIAFRKKLRRLPHIFSKILELPFNADADVIIKENEESFHFVIPAKGFSDNEVRAQAMEICPGVTKVVIVENGEFAGVQLVDDLEMDRWRFRLPSCTRPELSTAVYSGGELTVIVPKSGIAGEEINHLIVVQ